MKIRRIELEFDHFQFMVGDRIAGLLVDTGELWNADERIGFLPDCTDMAGVQTARLGGKTIVSVAVSEHGNSADEGWMKIGVFELNVPSGQVLVWSPDDRISDDAHSASVAPGHYDVTAYSKNVDDVVDEMDIEGPDEYLLLLSLVPDRR